MNILSFDKNKEAMIMYLLSRKLGRRFHLLFLNRKVN